MIYDVTQIRNFSVEANNKNEAMSKLSSKWRNVSSEEAESGILINHDSIYINNDNDEVNETIEITRYIVEKNGGYLVLFEDDCFDFSPDIDDADVYCSYNHATMAIQNITDLYDMASELNILKIEKQITILETRGVPTEDR